MDLDDTLLSSDKTISPDNRAAIRAALTRGHSVIVTTGRPVSSGKRVVSELGLTMPGCYMIAFNGSVLYDCAADRMLKERTVPLSCVRHLFGEAKRAGLHIQTYDKSDVLAERYNEELRYYIKSTQMSYRLIPDVWAVTEEPHKLLLVHLAGRQALEDFQRANDAWAKGRVDSFFSCDQYLEYCPIGVSKGAAVLDFCDHFGIPVERTVAVGDEWNDVSMIRAAHVGVAVRNAVDAAKEAADYVTERDCNQSAVAEVIERFLG